MYKKLILIFLLLTLLCIMSLVYADSAIKVDAKLGIVSINYKTEDYSKIRVLIQKNNEKYVYNLFSEKEVFALQMGDGTYDIGIYRQVSGNKYSSVARVQRTVDIDEMVVYQASVQNINWDTHSKSTELAEVLTSEVKTEQEKFDAVYKYVVETIAYDFEKAKMLRTASRYVPSNDVTIRTEKGVCYDYSSLMASMLRSLDIPTKLVEGKSSYTVEYHAWNEVYLDGKWVVVDTTTDAQLHNYNAKYEYAKSESDYSAVKHY